MSPHASGSQEVDALEELSSFGIQVWQFEVARAKSVKFLEGSE